MPELRKWNDVLIDDDTQVFLDEQEFGKFLYYADALEKEQDAWES